MHYITHLLRRHGVLLFLDKFVMHIVDINRVNLDPAILGDVVQIIDTTRSTVAMRRVVNRALAHINRFLQGQIRAPVIVQDTVRQQRTRPDGKVLSVQPRGVIVHVVKLGTRLVPARDHGAHAETVTAVAHHGVCEELGGGRDGDAPSVAEFVEAALHAEFALPVGAVGGAAGHGAQQERVNFNDFFDGTGTDVISHGGTRIDTDDDAAIEFESERGGSFGKLEFLVLVGLTASRGKVVAAVESGL